jgi:AraC-like DNA-binding protein
MHRLRTSCSSLVMHRRLRRYDVDMPKLTDESSKALTSPGTVWPAASAFRPANSPSNASVLTVYAPGITPCAGSVYSHRIDVDLKWHRHDMHQLSCAFEGAVEIESTRGRNLVPRQLAVWIPAGVPHCTRMHCVRWVSVFFPALTVADAEQRVRTVMVSPLMREMMREAMRWPIGAPVDALRTSFFDTMSRLCTEWIAREADLFLPTSSDSRVQRALDYTTQHMELKLADVCDHASMSVRSLRRHLQAEIGMTWEAYRHRGRLLQAISLLSETQESVGEIAARCGFESPSAFAKVFRTTMGEAPREYRNRARDPALNDEELLPAK